MRYKYGDIVEINAAPYDWPDVVPYNGMRGKIKLVDSIRGVYVVQIVNEHQHKIDTECGWKITNVPIPEWSAKKVLVPASEVPVMRVE